MVILSIFGKLIFRAQSNGSQGPNLLAWDLLGSFEIHGYQHEFFNPTDLWLVNLGVEICWIIENRWISSGFIWNSRISGLWIWGSRSAGFFENPADKWHPWAIHQTISIWEIQRINWIHEATSQPADNHPARIQPWPIVSDPASQPDSQPASQSA